MKEVEIVAASCTMLCASFLAHILAGGDTISVHSAGLLLTLSCAIAVLISKKSDDPFIYVIAIFIAQNFSHLILGGHAKSDSQMLFSHIAAGVISYQLLTYFNRELPGLGSFFAKIFIRKFSLPVLSSTPQLSSIPEAPVSLSGREFLQSFSLRAPPLK